MKPDPKTLALVALASGMLASAHMIGPAPGATASATPWLLVASAVAPPPPASTIKTFRAPVPLLITAHREFFTASPATDEAPAQNPDIATTPVDDAATQAAAKAAVELDGYRNVRGLVKGPDGSWRGRALRGSTEVAIRVDASGSVAAD
jgi:hypothetical protein